MTVFGLVGGLVSCGTPPSVASPDPAPIAETPPAPPRPEPPTPDEPSPEPPPPEPKPEAKGNPMPRATQFAEELAKLGLDPKKLPKMSELTKQQKTKVMPLLQKSLGFDDCTGCHVKDDFPQRTRMTKVAKQMWDELTAPHGLKSGEGLFCDSCHQGQKNPLDRSDPEKVKAFMKEGYVGQLVRKGAPSHGCASCHGRPVEPQIIEKRWGIAPGG